MASTSSTPPARSIVSPKLYDVFISHRGPDVKQTLAKQLYDLLKARECKAFLDREEIEGGDSIPFAIENGILSSRVQIAIFSKGYAESSWCLNELVLMLQQTDDVFIPVFYNVQPWELRYINNQSQYAAAFSGYQQKGRNLDKLDEWKGALVSASNISGYELSHHQDNLCEKIVSRVVQVIQEKRRNTHLYVAKYPVALDELVQDFEKCCSKTAGMVGIFGLGGSGKTTLAKELLNRKRSGYDYSCFLSDVRESRARDQLHCLQRQLLQDLGAGTDQEVKDVNHGTGKLKEHLRRTMHLRFLIILDDIDHNSQIDALLPEGILGSGWLIIITTRDQSVLTDADIRYKMKKMDTDHAKELFCSHSFHGGDTPAAYEKLVESFVDFCGGLPLSLIVLGAHVYRRDEKYWKQVLEKVKKIPPKHIIQRLRISFDGLDREEKQIFIDIACLFNKRLPSNLKSDAIIIWNASGWSAEYALQTLQDKCLVEVNEGEAFAMHDHLRDLGRQMADELGPPRLWRSELLRSMEAKGLEQLLAEAKGRCYGRFEDLTVGRQITYFIAETGLLWVTIGNRRDDLSMSIPSWIPLHKLYILVINRVEELWSTFQQQFQINPQASFELRKLTITDSHSLQKLPDLIGMFSHLEELEIINSLEKIDATSLAQSIKQLSNLRSLKLVSMFGDSRENFDLSKGRDSNNSDSFTSSRMDNLETIKLFFVVNISKLVISGEMCPRLRLLEVRFMRNVKEMELKKLETLSTLELFNCPQLEAISDLSTLIGLQKLTLDECDGLKWVHLAHLHRLQEIKITRCRGLQSVEWEEELPGLTSLRIGILDDRCASCVRNYICGLKKLPTKKIMQIVFEQEEMGGVSSKLNANMFTEVVGAHEVSEIENDYEVKISSSSSAITIFALLVTSWRPYGYSPKRYFDSAVGVDLEPGWDSLITVVVTQHDIEGCLEDVIIKKGFKVTLKTGEEGKALTVLQRIADRLYPQSTVPNVVA